MNVTDVAKLYGKSPQWVRAGIIEGWLPIGIATRNGKKISDISEISSRKGRINYWIDKNKVLEEQNASIIRKKQ